MINQQTQETAVERENAPESFEYPRNSNGDPEFASVIVTLDHLMDSHPFHVNQKMVYSTQSPEEVLLSLMDYYQESHLKSRNDTINLLVTSRAAEAAACFIYVVPQTFPDRKGGLIVQAILSTPAMRALLEHPDFGANSALITCHKLVETVTTVLGKIKEAKGAYPPVSLVVLEPGT